MTWNEVAAESVAHAIFVQWIVATYGPLPDGPIDWSDYRRFLDEFNTRSTGR